MSFTTKHLKLTKDQKERGVCYSSVLIVTNASMDSVLHEVFWDEPRRDEKIRNLKDVTFFKNMARDMGWNVVNEVRS